MARPLRIQFPGAVYHVMARGNHGQPIYRDDQDRRCWLKTLGEACLKTGWRVHAFVLMGNHYHLLLETPEANLVAGMKWLQGAFTQRYNGRHRCFGHLFQGRYKAVLVDSRKAETYLQVVSTYIHLNPARARLIRPGDQPLSAYRWSSYPWYVGPRGERPAWFSSEKVLGSVGLAPGQARGYAAYLEGRVLEWASEGGRQRLAAEWKALRRGWYVGGDSFRKQLLERLKPGGRAPRRESHSGPAQRAHDEAAAELALRRGLGALGLTANELGALPKGAAEKSVLAWWLRRQTTVTLRWVGERLDMGHYTRVTQAVSRVERRPSRRVARLRDCLRQSLDQGAP